MERIVKRKYIYKKQRYKYMVRIVGNEHILTLKKEGSKTAMVTPITKQQFNMLNISTLPEIIDTHFKV